MSPSKIIVTLILMTLSTWAVKGNATFLTSSFLSSSASLPADAAASASAAASGTPLIHHRKTTSLGHRARASVRGLATSKFNYTVFNSHHYEPHYSPRFSSRLMLLNQPKQPLLVDNLVESEDTKHLPIKTNDVSSNASSISLSSSSSAQGRATNTSEQVFNFILHKDEVSLVTKCIA